MSYIKQIHELVNKYHDEVANGGVVEKSPSRLCRGEGVQKQFFILKIDLVNSTMMLGGRRASTYLKLAHTYLSVIDEIAQKFGADPQQMEYAGDGLLAYFASDETGSEQVMIAASYMVEAVSALKGLNATFSDMNPVCKCVIHHSSLTVARIGPRGSSMLSAIGYPIHYVSKLEKDISGGSIRATVPFYKMVPASYRRFLSPVYGEVTSPVCSTSTFLTAPVTSNGLINAARGLHSNEYQTQCAASERLHGLSAIAAGLYLASAPAVREPVGYDLLRPMLLKQFQ